MLQLTWDWLSDQHTGFSANQNAREGCQSTPWLLDWSSWHTHDSSRKWRGVTCQPCNRGYKIVLCILDIDREFYQQTDCTCLASYDPWSHRQAPVWSEAVRGEKKRRFLQAQFFFPLYTQVNTGLPNKPYVTGHKVPGGTTHRSRRIEKRCQWGEDTPAILPQVKARTKARLYPCLPKCWSGRLRAYLH